MFPWYSRTNRQYSHMSLVAGEWPTDDINDKVDEQEKSLVSTLLNQKQNFI